MRSTAFVSLAPTSVLELHEIMYRRTTSLKCIPHEQYSCNVIGNVYELKQLDLHIVERRIIAGSDQRRGHHIRRRDSYDVLLDKLSSLSSHGHHHEST
jgi:hypothetical protein